MNKDFSYYLSKFFKEYLTLERNMSIETIRSYKTTFKLLIEFLVNNKNIKLKNINFSTVNKDLIIDFLNYLEAEKENSIRTRNQRLAAIKSFYEYCTFEEIDNIENIKKILSMKFKKYTKPIQDYLTEEELEKFFNSIDFSSKIGKRNLLLLTILYDTAARASEIINLKLEDIHLQENYIILLGKGNKKRAVPIMDKTKEIINSYIKSNKNQTYLFENSKGNQYNKYFIKDVIASINKNTKTNKKITPHTFRRSRAIHLLSHGVNIIYIQELLGHSSVDTTQDYVRAITQRKFDAIESVSIKTTNELPNWSDDKNLLDQLLNL